MMIATLSNYEDSPLPGILTKSVLNHFFSANELYKHQARALRFFQVISDSQSRLYIGIT